MIERLKEENAALSRRIAALEERLGGVEHKTPDPAALIDRLPGIAYRGAESPDGPMIYVSAGALELTGWRPDDLLSGQIRYRELILPEDRERVRSRIQEALDENGGFELLYRIRTADNGVRWVQEWGWPIHPQIGETEVIEGFVADVSDYKATEQALRERERRYRLIVECSQEGIWMLGTDHRTTFVNSRLAEMLGYGPDQMLGTYLWDFVGEEWRTAMRDRLEQSPPGVAEQLDLKLVRKNGEEIWVLLSSNSIIEETAGYLGTIAMVIDITDRKQMETALHELAISDPLTGLLNRRHFYHLAQQELQRSQRYRSPLAAIMTDLDHFKTVNDKFGHIAGDQVLQSVARILRESVRQSDILCRYGGEEFAILLPETDIRTASVTAERLRSTLNEAPIETDQASINLTISLGVVGIHSPSNAITVEELLDRADRMLYVAKEGGRNQVAIWDLSTNRKVRTKPATPDGKGATEGG